MQKVLYKKTDLSDTEKICKNTLYLHTPQSIRVSTETRHPLKREVKLKKYAMASIPLYDPLFFEKCISRSLVMYVGKLCMTFNC